MIALKKMKFQLKMLLPTTTTATPQTIKSCRRHQVLFQSLQTHYERMIGQSGVVILVLSSLVSPQPPPGYPSVLLRCSLCTEAEEDSGEVCGSDWKTYSSQCQLEWEACKRNWSIVQVSGGRCVSQCQDVDLGRFSSQHFTGDSASLSTPRYVLGYGIISGNKQGKLHPGLLQVQEALKTTRTGGPGSQGVLSR